MLLLQHHLVVADDAATTPCRYGLDQRDKDRKRERDVGGGVGREREPVVI